MASLLLTVGVLSYDQIKKQKAKRAAKKEHNNARFSELERENARRIDALRNNTCFCQQSDWQGGGCERHGYVPAAGTPGGPPGPEDAGPPAYGDGEAFAPTRIESHPRGERGEYMDATMVDGAGGDGLAGIWSNSQRGNGYQYRRGEEDGFLAEQPAGDGPSGRRSAPPPMPEDEVRRINEERRKRMKTGSFANWRLRRKSAKSEGEGVVR